MNTNSIVMWVILLNNADWDCFKTPILREILRIQNPLLEEHYAFLEVIHLFQGNTIQTPERPGRPVVNDKNQRSQGMTNVLNHIDCVPSNVQFSHQEALLYVFEDNEAVIKMIINGKESHNETCFQDPQSCA